MSCMSYTISEEKSNLLVSGYIREQEMESIPEALTQLFFKFYNDALFITLSGDDLNKFISCKHSDKYYGPIIEIMGIKWQCIFYPNGEFVDEEGYIQFYLELIKTPSNMKHVIIYYIMNCVEANYECRSCHRFQTVGNATAWPPFNVYIEKYKKSKQLHFGCYVDVKHIIYNKNDKDDIKQKHYTAPISMNIYSEYKWDITDELLTRFKNGECGQGIYSPNYGNNSWCLIIAPNGDNKNNKGSFIVGPKILQLPFEIGRIWVEYTLETNYDNITWKETKMFHYNKKCAQWTNDTFLNSALKDINYLWLKVTNKIIAVYDDDWNFIQQDEWSKYGIQ